MVRTDFWASRAPPPPMWWTQPGPNSARLLSSLAAWAPSPLSITSLSKSPLQSRLAWNIGMDVLIRFPLPRVSVFYYRCSGDNSSVLKSDWLIGGLLNLEFSGVFKIEKVSFLRKVENPRWLCGVVWCIGFKNCGPFCIFLSVTNTLGAVWISSSENNTAAENWYWDESSFSRTNVPVLFYGTDCSFCDYTIKNSFPSSTVFLFIF